jgi:hypothetical protein
LCTYYSFCSCLTGFEHSILFTFSISQFWKLLLRYRAQNFFFPSVIMNHNRHTKSVVNLLLVFLITSISFWFFLRIFICVLPIYL